MAANDKIRLNHNLPKAEVFPPERGAHWFQNGLYFTHDGKLVDDDELQGEDGARKIKQHDRMSRADKAAEEARQKALAEDSEDAIDTAGQDAGATDDALATAQKRENSSSAVERQAPPDTENTASDESKVAARKSIIGWLTGEERFQFFAVSRLYKDAFGVVVQDKKRAIEVALEKGLLTSDRIKI